MEAFKTTFFISPPPIISLTAFLMCHQERLFRNKLKIDKLLTRQYVFCLVNNAAVLQINTKLNESKITQMTLDSREVRPIKYLIYFYSLNLQFIIWARLFISPQFIWNVYLIRKITLGLYLCIESPESRAAGPLIVCTVSVKSQLTFQSWVKKCCWQANTATLAAWAKYLQRGADPKECEGNYF